MGRAPRYRVEDGKSCIDIRVKSSRQLFDFRDPSPFRERDLDDDAVEYIVGAASELPPKDPVKLVFWLGEDEPPLPSTTIAEAVTAHFVYERDKKARALRGTLRRGPGLILLGLAALGALVFLSELVGPPPATHLRNALREGLLIAGWVAVWRPLEAILYDWWPILEQRRLFQRLVDAEISVRKDADGTTHRS